MEEKETKICPFCGKEISIKAKKCKHNIERVCCPIYVIKL